MEKLIFKHLEKMFEIFSLFGIRGYLLIENKKNSRPIQKKKTDDNHIIII